MTNEEKQLLIIDLCGRLPYGVKCKMWDGKAIEHSITETLRISGLDAFMCNDSFSIKPYLRPMSSMTKEEIKEFEKNTEEEHRECYNLRAEGEPRWMILEQDSITAALDLDWLNTHNFDYRGLIPMGLALEAPADMYKTE